MLGTKHSSFAFKNEISNRDFRPIPKFETESLMSIIIIHRSQIILKFIFRIFLMVML